MYGSGYVIDHCISAFLQKKEERSYRVYVTDALYCITHNTAKYAGGKECTIRWEDIITPSKEPEKSGDEIALEILKKLSMEEDE